MRSSQTGSWRNQHKVFLRKLKENRSVFEGLWPACWYSHRYRRFLWSLVSSARLSAAITLSPSLLLYHSVALTVLPCRSDFIITVRWAASELIENVRDQHVRKRQTTSLSSPSFSLAILFSKLFFFLSYFLSKYLIYYLTVEWKIVHSDLWNHINRLYSWWKCDEKICLQTNKPNPTRMHLTTCVCLCKRSSISKIHFIKTLFPHYSLFLSLSISFLIFFNFLLSYSFYQAIYLLSFLCISLTVFLLSWLTFIKMRGGCQMFVCS